MFLLSLIILQVIFFSLINRQTLLSPLFIVVFSIFMLTMIISPFMTIIFSSAYNPFIDIQYQKVFIILNIVLFSWFIGFTLFSKKSQFSFDPVSSNYDLIRPSYLKFGFFCLISGFAIYCLTYIYVGYSYIEALNNPLQFRFDVIGKTGGYYLRNFSLWLIYCSLAIFLVHYFDDLKSSIKQKVLLSLFLVFIFFITIPLGQRSVLLTPLLLGGFILYNQKMISKSQVLYGVIISLFLIGALGIYRTVAFFEVSSSQDLSIIYSEIMRTDFRIIFEEIAARFNNIEWFYLYLSEESYFEGSISVFESIKQLFISIVPPSFLGGIEKSVDYDTYLTIYFLGSQDFGTYGFTPMAEWSLIFGKKGYVIMPFISGSLFAFISNKARKIKNNMFYLIFISSFIFLDLVFIQIHAGATANAIVFLCFNILLFFLYEAFFKPIKQSFI